MEKIYSKIDSDTTLAVIFRSDDFDWGRKDIIDPQEYLQCAALQLEKDTTFRPHKHFPKFVDRSYPQEAWYIVRGKVMATVFDCDDKIIAEPIVNEGDVIFMLAGGHNYKIVEQARILEFKVGPYVGQEADKTFID